MQKFWMTMDEAAVYLRCGDRYLRELVTQEQVPHTMFAGKALFHPMRLDGWLLRLETPPHDEGIRIREGGSAMIEADMERLLRDYSSEFFEEQLQLVSQQERFASGITDLIFEDTQGDLLVVELKRGVLQREHIAQVIDYLGDVEARYADKNVELMVVANVIPPQRRTKLERLGVSFKEIPEARFREVAAKYGVELSEGQKFSAVEAASHAERERVQVMAECAQERVSSLIAELIGYGERWVAGLGQNLKEDLENSSFGWLSVRTYAQLSRWCHPNRHTGREQWVIPRAHELSRQLFGRVIERTYHPSYGS